MSKRLGLVGVAILSLLVSMLVAASPAHAAVGLRVSGTKIVEANGNTFVMRGASHAHTWYTSQTSSFAGIKSLKGNTVRVVLSGGRWTANGTSDVANIVSLCKTNKLVCVLENHDTTGYGEQSGAYSLDQAVDYWSSVKSALVGHEDYIVINIGNEPYGNNSVSGWTSATKSAISRMRGLGFQHLLMVDAPNWGQDWSFTMRDNAASVFAADSQRNTVFSVHMYGVFDTSSEINSYLSAFQSAGLPLVIGEFGYDHSDGNPDEDTIMAQAQSRGIGYIGWSWSGNGGGVEYLDMVNNFSASSLTNWGQRFFNGSNGVVQTSREATYFGGTSNDTTAPTTPGTPTASSVSSSGATLNWSASTDSGGSGLAGYNVYREQGSTDTLLTQTTTNSATLTGLSASTQYEVYVRARDGAGNLSSASSSVTFTTTGGTSDTTAPTTPGTPTASSVSSSGATLNWSASTDSGGSGLAGYNVYREQGSTDTLLTQTTTNSATLTGLSASTQYEVYVRARDGAGNLSSASSSVTFTTTGGTGGGCSATGTAQNQWHNGYVVQPVTVTNGGSSSISGWTVTFTLPSGHSVTGSWNATLTTSGQTVTAKNASYNGTLAAGATTSFGFQVSRPDGDTSVPGAYTCSTS
ncbi:cellulase family glycosylhydrolase [Streptosporangium sp. NPDC002721]|uniref:cellulase family glycosylhydrolase n=1 Tax=Streptosporangium sp. NPDC002721 TaxID=3366188 RepID=UPI0036BEFCD3